MQTYDVNIELDKDGNVDTAHYIKLAHELRAAALAQSCHGVSLWFKGLRKSFNSTRSFGTVFGH